MTLTGQELIEHFKNCCEKRNKLFIPDSPRQEAVAEALSKFYNPEILLKACDLFIKSNNGPFIIFDFAIQSKTYTDKIQFDAKSSEKFKDVVKQTKLRMELE